MATYRFSDRFTIDLVNPTIEYWKVYFDSDDVINSVVNVEVNFSVSNDNVIRGVQLTGVSVNNFNHDPIELLQRIWTHLNANNLVE